MEVVPLSTGLHHHVYRGNPEAHHSCEDYDVVEEIVGVQAFFKGVYLVLEIFGLLGLINHSTPWVFYRLEFLEGCFVNVSQENATQKIRDRNGNSKSDGSSPYDHLIVGVRSLVVAKSAVEGGQHQRLKAENEV